MTCKIGSLDRYYPADAFFCARTTRDVMRWNVPDITRLAEYRLDATPAQLAGFAGALPFIAQEAAATPLALDFMAHCGLPGASDLRVYRTVQEAEALALDLMANGLKLAYNFGTLPGLEARVAVSISWHPIYMQCSMPSSRLRVLCRVKILHHA
jgi:hypothetical protein